MRAIVLSICLAALLCGSAQAQPLYQQELPEPVAYGLQRLDHVCREGGGHLTFPEILSTGYLETDANGDSEPDYIVYQCEYACDWRTNFYTNGHACAFNMLVMSGWPWYSVVDIHGEPRHSIEREEGPQTLIGLRRNFGDEGPEEVCEGYFCWVAWEFDGNNLNVTHWAPDEESLRAMLESEDQ
ncbi:MAG: hypothetical protein AAF414_08810 [Pseudomonadota bacterium]